MINVTKTYLPDKKKLLKYIDKIYENSRLTNNGPLVQELTKRLEDYLGVENLLLVANGTLALQVAYKTLGINGAAITTPFSFVATTSSLVWEGIKPQYADIDPETFCINPDNIESKITASTSAVVPVHVFGNACNVDRIKEIAKKNGLKTIYDGAHAFGIKYKGRSLLSYGDATTISFHATKLFHTIEGGAIVFKEKSDLEKAKLLINFGIDGPDSVAELGINAKMNEFEAAMGLSLLEEFDSVIEERRELWRKYENDLLDSVKLQKWNSDNNNYAYFPVLFRTEEDLLEVIDKLNRNIIFPRRYFYPSLNTLGSIQENVIMPVSENISKRVLCLPIYNGLEVEDVDRILGIILDREVR